MAEKGRAYVFGQGQFKANPIHGEDLANFCIEKLKGVPGTYEVGGPEILTQEEIARIAFEVLDQPVKITRLPIMLVRSVKKILVLLTRQTFYGPIEFFMTVLTMDMIAPRYGKHTVKEFFSAQ